ncbi:MAG: hypothetical protein AAB966_04875, partial [Patescibacteria group bacterium]
MPEEAQKENPQVIFTWEAPLRPYVKRSSEVIRFYIALAILITLIVFFFGDYILLIPIWGLMFIFYVFTVTPPHAVTHKITKFGVETSGHTFRFEDLAYFYFSHRFGFVILTLVT